MNEEFSVPWSTIETFRSSTNPSGKSTSVTVNKTKREHSKQRTSEIALFIHDEYLKNVETKDFSRPILNELKTIVRDLNDEYPFSSCERLAKLLTKLKKFFVDQRTLSVYEFASSGLVDILLKLFEKNSSDKDSVFQRAALFCSIFLSDDQSTAFHFLIRKLVSLLESIEKSPLFLYDTSLNCGMQIFSKRFRFQIRYENDRQMFLDRTGKSLNVEPLTTVGQLKNFLASMVSKQWFDYPHNHFEFVKQLKIHGRMTFSYNSDFDTNGILFWIGTNGKIVDEYTNPHSIGLVTVQCSEGNLTGHQLAKIIQHPNATESNDETQRQFNSLTIDFGLLLLPSHITLRCNGNASVLSHWSKTIIFHLSKDNFRYVPCETTLLVDGPSPILTWKIENSFDSNVQFRYLRINTKTGRNLVSLGGLEIYGDVFSSIDIRSKPELSRSRSTREDNRQRSTTNLQHSISTSAAAIRANKLHSHLLRRFPNLRAESSTTQSVIDRILGDFPSMPNNLFSGEKKKVKSKNFSSIF